MKKSFSFVTSQHFTCDLNESEMKKLFKSSVKMVEVEVFSYCNRKCSFCPNFFIDRFSKNIYMEEAIYLKMLEELAQVDYDGVISFSRYNEPLADKIILTRLRQAKQYIPKAKLHTNTNGDYLSKEYLEALYEAGLRSLKIQVYPNGKYDDQDILDRMHLQLNKLGLPYHITETKPGVRIEAKLKYQNMGISIYGRNFDVTGCSRGGLVAVRNDYRRTAPCFSPFRDIYLDFNGQAVPCCNIRSDAPEHHSFVVGDLKAMTIFQIYTSEALVEWRRNLIKFGPKKSPCNSCHFSVPKKNLGYYMSLWKINFKKIG